MKISKFDWEPNFLMLNVRRSVYSFDSLFLEETTKLSLLNNNKDILVSVRSNINSQKNIECAKGYSFSNRIMMEQNVMDLKKPSVAVHHHQKNTGLATKKGIVADNEQKAKASLSIFSSSKEHSLLDGLSYLSFIYAKIIYNIRQVPFKISFDHHSISVPFAGLNSMFGFGHTLNVLDWECSLVLTFHGASNRTFYNYIINKK